MVPLGGLEDLPPILQQLGVDPLADDDLGEKELIISEASSSKAVLSGDDLKLHDEGDLSVTNTIPELYIMILAGKFPLISAYFL